MIHKVNRPAFLSLVAQPKAPQNDPGGSQGSGNFYEQQPSANPEASQEAPPKPTLDPEDEPKAKLAVVVTVEQIGMTGVVKDFLENKKNEPQATAPGLSLRYTNDSQPAKGLLLNKKAE